MALIGMWMRLELRRRWRSLLVLALLVALSAATVLTAVAAARRGDTALDRLLQRTLPATAAVLPNDPDFDWDPVRALPGVAALATFPVASYDIDGIPADVSDGFPFDAAFMDTLERPVVLQGRLPDPTRADEGVITPGFTRTYGLGVGDTVTLHLPSPEATDAEFAGGPTGAEPPPGPTLQVHLVGVVRSLWLSDGPGQPGGFAPSAGLLARYRSSFLGTSGKANFVNALVRLDGGPAALPAFRRDLAALTGRPDIQLLDQGEQEARIQATITFESLSVLAFGLAALAAAIMLVGQAVSRYTAAAVADLRVLRAIGMAPRGAVLAAMGGPTLAALLGAVVAVAGAVVASAWMPFGNTALLEPTPGIDVDVPVLLGGGLLALLLVAGAAAATAWWSLSATRTEGAGRRSLVATAAARAGLPVPVVIGARFALEPGRGRSALPVRPALIGSVVGVLGTLAAFTFSAGVADAAANPARFGQTAQLQAYLGFEGNDFLKVDDVLRRVGADPDVLSTLDARSAVLTSGETTFTAYSYASVGAAPFPTVVLRGAMPARADQVVLGPSVANALHLDVGDPVALTGTGGSATFTISGVGFEPAGPHNDYDNAGWVTPQAYDRLVTGFKFHVAYIALRPGADPNVVKDRLAGSGGQPSDGPLPVEVIRPPLQAAQIQTVQVLPVVLGGFLALLAVGAVGHALATAVRRRRYDVAVLRALGMTRWQARSSVITQATLLAVIGLLFGIPLGLALGRVLWRVVADITPLQYVAPLALLALLLAAPVAVLVANALAAWPGRQAARLRIGAVLRAE